jgi:hypothetical protein
MQFDASHWPAPHCPFVASHSRPCMLQSMQSLPERPHESASAPARQISTPLRRSQHPLQFAQPLRPHDFSFASHESKPCPTQSLHTFPPVPHARVSVPRRQRPLESQHPVGQFSALHVFGCVVLPLSSDSGSRLVRPQPDARTTRMVSPAAKQRTKRTSEDRRIGDPRSRTA